MTAARSASALFTWILVLTPTLVAQGSPWPHPDGSTHWYEPVAVAGGVDWATAHAAAAARGGHLVTITSKEENDFLFKLIDQPAFWTQVGSTWQGPWTGGVQLPASQEPSGGWIWGELEPFAHSAWSAGQPDDAGGADRIHFGGGNTRSETWADAPAGEKRPGYVVEYARQTSPRSVGLQRRDPGSFDGYTLFNPRLATQTFLVDPRGRVVRRWTSTHEAGLAAMLLPNGHLIRAGRIFPSSFPVAGVGGIVEEVDWQDQPVWSFQHSSGDYALHHDIEPLPNGNVLLISWERKGRAEAIQAGRDPNLLPPSGDLWPEKVIEIKPDGSGGATVVWEWHVWDHLIQDYDSSKANHGDVARHPELIDANFTPDGRRDWMHMNAIAYNPALDQIVLSVLTFGEIWIIDHSTTTALAAGHTGGRSGKGGDLLYRWGNPAAYRAGSAADRRLFGHHDAHWIPPGLPGAGNLLLFHNGAQRTPVAFSTVEELVPPAVDARGNYPRAGNAWGPSLSITVFQDTPPDRFFAPYMSSAQRLRNGNTLIHDGPVGRMFEVTAKGSVVWEYVNPLHLDSPVEQGTVVTDNDGFRVLRYAPDYPAFAGKTLTAGEPVETYAAGLLVDGSSLPQRTRIGESTDLDLRSSPTFAGKLYQVVTSATPGAVPVDYRWVRVGADPLLFATLGNLHPGIFSGYVGLIGADGRALATIRVPAIAGLAGLELQTAFAVVDPLAPSGLGFISNTVRTTLH